MVNNIVSTDCEIIFREGGLVVSKTGPVEEIIIPIKFLLNFPAISKQNSLCTSTTLFVVLTCQVACSICFVVLLIAVTSFLAISKIFTKNSLLLGFFLCRHCYDLDAAEIIGFFPYAVTPKKEMTGNSFLIFNAQSRVLPARIALSNAESGFQVDFHLNSDDRCKVKNVSLN